jgi:hypothetical protein
MTIPAGSEDPTELYPSVGAGAAVYGDGDTSAQQIYPANPWFFWNQPLSDSAWGWVRTHAGDALWDGRWFVVVVGNGQELRVLLGTGDRQFLAAAILVLLHVLVMAVCCGTVATLSEMQTI